MASSADVRRFAIARSLLEPTTLAAAVERMGFVQADPIRAPARAQDLTLRHRVGGYRAGDLEARYADLDIEEDVFINYGYVPRSVYALMHPRTKRATPPVARTQRERNLLAFVRERGDAHPRDVDRHFSHGRVTNYWGGLSKATTHLLEHLHYRGLVRVARRERGVRIYAVRDHAAQDALDRDARIDALVDIVVRAYAPMTSAGLAMTVSRLRYAVPQWRLALEDALRRARARLSRTYAGGADWFWPADEKLGNDPIDEHVRLLTPFDPIVWDRRRFEQLWGWPYRFEAYTPAAKRKLGYYALPMLWHDRFIGWANLSVVDGTLNAEFGYVKSKPRDRAFARELALEIDRIRRFLPG